MSLLIGGIATLITAQATDAGMAASEERACRAGITVVSVNAGPHQSPISLDQAATLGELVALSREIPVLTGTEARRIVRVPELVIVQHVVRLKGDLFFVVRAELRETWLDSGGIPRAVIVWQGEPQAGVTDQDSAKDVLNRRITQVAAGALRECRR